VGKTATGKAKDEKLPKAMGCVNWLREMGLTQEPLSLHGWRNEQQFPVGPELINRRPNVI